MLTRKGLCFLCVTAWLITYVKVEAYMSSCNGGYCFVISDYKNNDELLYQSNAQQRCLSNGTQLVEILNQNIQNALVNFIKSTYPQGLNGWNVLTNGKRSPSDWIRLNGNGIDGISVKEQTDASYAYGYLKSATIGFDPFASRPGDKKGFICTGLSDCSGGTTISDQCYKSFAETLSWYDARNRCLDEGGDLASFDQITTNAGFNALNGSWISKSNSYWIGIRRELWKWQNANSDVKYSEWFDSHPLGSVFGDCICLSTTIWEWIECGCNPPVYLPFVCISASSSSTTSTQTSATTTTKGTSNLASAIDRVETPTIPVAVTSKSTQDGNDTGSMDQSIEHNKQAVIGIGVGVGVGGALIVIALVAVVIILCRKRPLRCPERKKAIAKPQPPDILMKDGNENPYAHVVSSTPELNNTDATIVYANDSQTHTVYAPIGFCTEPQVHHDGNVNIVAGKTKPSQVTIPPKNNAAAKHFQVGGDLYAEVTKA